MKIIWTMVVVCIIRNKCVVFFVWKRLVVYIVWEICGVFSVSEEFIAVYLARKFFVVRIV